MFGWTAHSHRVDSIAPCCAESFVEVLLQKDAVHSRITHRLLASYLSIVLFCIISNRLKLTPFKPRIDNCFVVLVLCCVSTHSDALSLPMFSHMYMSPRQLCSLLCDRWRGKRSITLFKRFFTTNNYSPKRNIPLQKWISLRHPILPSKNNDGRWLLESNSMSYRLGTPFKTILFARRPAETLSKEQFIRTTYIPFVSCIFFEWTC